MQEFHIRTAKPQAVRNRDGTMPAQELYASLRGQLYDRRMPAQDLQPRRDLNLTHATSLVVGITIGTGVFLKTAAMAQAVGSPALVVAAWAVAPLAVRVSDAARGRARLALRQHPAVLPAKTRRLVRGASNNSE